MVNFANLSRCTRTRSNRWARAHYTEAADAKALLALAILGASPSYCDPRYRGVQPLFCASAWRLAPQ
jgi:hypothetical protein